MAQSSTLERSPLVRAVLRGRWDDVPQLPSPEDIEADIDMLLSSFQLHLVRRYLDQVHWSQESDEAHRADIAEPGLKLENVAAHSWHVADAVLLLAPHFA